MNSNKNISHILAGLLNSTALIMCLITENMWELKCSIVLHKGRTVQENITVLYVKSSQRYSSLNNNKCHNEMQNTLTRI